MKNKKKNSSVYLIYLNVFTWKGREITIGKALKDSFIPRN